MCARARGCGCGVRVCDCVCVCVVGVGVVGVGLCERSSGYNVIQGWVVGAHREEPAGRPALLGRHQLREHNLRR